MAAVGIKLELQTADLEALQKRLRELFPNPVKAAILEGVLKKALEPTLTRLRANTPVGPTGNLKRAASVKVVGYDSSGNAVGLIGYRRAGQGASRSAAGGKVRKGPDRAFHQFWLEDGTRDREITTIANKPYGRRGHLRRVRGRPAVEVRPHVVKAGQGSVIASSFVKLGRFSIERTPRQDEGQRVQTNPAYPGAFFKKAKKGETIRIDGMRPGGTTGKPPIATTWEQSRTEVAEILARELRISIDSALQSLIRSADLGVD